jgi:hypothetical protein
VSGRDRAQPLVAVVCRVPLVYEALTAALEGIADVRPFPAGRADTAGLLRALAPDAVVVDSEAEARDAEAFVRGTESLLVHVSIADETLRTFKDGRWQEPEDAASPEAIRNAVVGGIFGRKRVS